MSRMCRPKWPFLHVHGSHDMRLVDFRGLTGSQQTPRIWGVTHCFDCLNRSVKTSTFLEVTTTIAKSPELGVLS